MKTYTNNDFDILPTGFRGNVIDIINCEAINWELRLKIVIRKEFLTIKQMQTFAIQAARQVQHLMDPRSIKVLDVAESYLDGKATLEELKVAQNEAYTSNAFYVASVSAASYASSAASSAAYSTTSALASSAASSAYSAFRASGDHIKQKELLLSYFVDDSKESQTALKEALLEFGRMFV